MQEPTQTIAIATASPIVAVSLSNIAFWPFGIAFIFGTVTLIYADKLPLSEAVKRIIGSTFFGGSIAPLISPPVCYWLGNMVTSIKPWTDTAETSMTALLAIILALSAHRVVPALINKITKKIGD